MNDPTTDKSVTGDQKESLIGVVGSERSSDERSMLQLFWHRFKQHKLGVTGLIMICILLIIVVFAKFFSPYDYLDSNYSSNYVPPMVTNIRFDGFRPFVYGLERKPVSVEINGQTTRLPGIWDYNEDKSEKHYIKFFVKGHSYKLLGFWKTDIHLFGLGPSPRSGGQLFLLGSNNDGQDMLSRMLYAGRVTLGLAFIVIIVSFTLAIIVGGLSGFMGGAVDTALQRLTEIFMSLPRLALLIVLAGIMTYLGQVPAMLRFWAIAGLISIVNWASISRVIRGQFLSLRQAEYTQAAQAVGASNKRIILRHIMPNVMSYLVVAATLAVPDIIILESILSFLGYGIQHPMLSWGSMLANFTGQGVFTEMQFHAWMLMPAAFVVVTVLAFNFLGDALRDAVDPYSVVSVKGDES